MNINILGISAFYHDSAAALIQDGKILAAAQEESFTRIKHDSNFPVNAIQYCLKDAGLTLDQLDAVVFYDKPLLKFERLLETYYAFAPKGVSSFVTAIPVWLKEKMFLKKLIRKELKKVGTYDKKKLNLLFPEHHLSHAASAFYPSPFEEAAVLTIDGVGEWATASLCHGKGKDITVLKELRFPHSLGLLYSAFAYYLGFKVNSGEYKLMGLAPYGNKDGEAVKRYADIIKTNLVDIKEDGSIWLDQKYFNYAVGLKMTNNNSWEQLFGFPARKPDTDLQQHHCDLALAIQTVTEEVVSKMAREARRLTNSENLCLAGGVALNCVANGKLQNEKIFQNIFIQPAASDAGGAPGAALAAYHIYFEKNRIVTSDSDAMQGSYLGPEFTKEDISVTITKYNAKYTYRENFSEVAFETAQLLKAGNVIGWFQGRMEFGPRALGNRSILADAGNAEMQKKLNLKIKYRESFRPFAPSVCIEDVKNYFNMEGPSPYMLIVQNIKKEIRKPVPQNYNAFSLSDKLNYDRSSLPAVTHVDFSARVQTVDKSANEKYWLLLSEFKKLSGYSVVANTSFNVRGEPIVCTPEDAYKCFMRTEMDQLVMGNFIFHKNDQLAWKESKSINSIQYVD